MKNTSVIVNIINQQPFKDILPLLLVKPAGWIPLPAFVPFIIVTFSTTMFLSDFEVRRVAEIE